MRALRLIGLSIRIAALNELQYPVNFFLALIQSVIGLAVGLFTLTLVFVRVEELNGWTRPELFIVLGVYTSLGGLVRSVVRPGISQFFADLREGSLDYVFTKPVDSQLYVSFRAVQLPQAVDLVTGVILMAVGIGGLESPPDGAQVALFALAYVLAAVSVYSVLLILGTTAYWTLHPSQLLELFDGLWMAARWPVSIYPDWLRLILTAVIPIGVAVTVPAQALASSLAPPGMVVLAMVAIAFFVLSRVLWRLGARSYAGASS